MMYQCKFISCIQYTTVVKDVDNGEGYACVEAGDIREISALSLRRSEAKSALIKLSVLSKAKTKPTTAPSRYSGYIPSDSDYLRPMVLK